MRERLDLALVSRGLVTSRHKATDAIKRGVVQVNRRIARKVHMLVGVEDQLSISEDNNYVSRAALKLLPIIKHFKIEFADVVVLDVGSSTGGFTQVALEMGARRVYAVDVGTNQLHTTLRTNSKVVSIEKTDIRKLNKLPELVNLVLVDVSFISSRKILPHLGKFLDKNGEILLMLKPQFETNASNLHDGVIKNSAIRRKILKDFEEWIKNDFSVVNKQDSDLAGMKGNIERFYLLRPIVRH